MKNTENRSNKLWIGFGIITILSGIYLIFSGDYLIGFSGSSVGVLLIYQNMMVIKNHNNESDIESATTDSNNKEND